jgi:hypothetical protein
MVDPIDPSLPRQPQPRPAQTAPGAGQAARPAADSGARGDVVAPSLVEQLGEPGPAFDPFATAERAGRGLGGSDLSIGNARPETVATLRR